MLSRAHGLQLLETVPSDIVVDDRREVDGLQDLASLGEPGALAHVRHRHCGKARTDPVDRLPFLALRPGAKKSDSGVPATLGQEAGEIIEHLPDRCRDHFLGAAIESFVGAVGVWGQGLRSVGLADEMGSHSHIGGVAVISPAMTRLCEIAEAGFCIVEDEDAVVVPRGATRDDLVSTVAVDIACR